MPVDSASPLRVGYVLKKFPRLSETFILSEILGLEAAGHSVFVFGHRAADDEPRHAALARLKAPVTVLPKRPDPSSHELPELLSRFPHLQTFLAQLPENRRSEVALQGLCLARHAQELGLTHLHAHFATVAAHIACAAHLLGGPPFTVTAHAKDLYRHTVDAGLFRTLAEHAHALITVCDANLNWLRSHHLRDCTAQVVRIYNGQDLSPPSTPAPLVDPHLIVAVGRLVPKKGFDDLLHAAAALRDRGVNFLVRILGQGEEGPVLARLIDEFDLHSRVTLVGAVPHEVVQAEMRRAAVIAAPCRFDDDGNQDALPTVLLEALALGKPVITTDVGGIREIVDDHVHGRVLTPGDRSALANALAASLGEDSKKLADSARVAGPARMRTRFDRHQTIDQLANVFQSSAVARATP